MDKSITCGYGALERLVVQQIKRVTQNIHLLHTQSFHRFLCRGKHCRRATYTPVCILLGGGVVRAGRCHAPWQDNPGSGELQKCEDSVPLAGGGESRGVCAHEICVPEGGLEVEGARGRRGGVRKRE